MTIKVSVVLPTYNERENIALLIPSLIRMFHKEKLNAEIVVVDDSSPDGTANLVKKIARNNKNIRLIERLQKKGIGPALAQGYSVARGDILVSIDADSFVPQDVTVLVNRILQGADMVLGSRYKKNSRYEKVRFKTVIKHMVSVTGNRITRIMTGICVSDYSLNCRAMTKECWHGIRNLVTEKGSAMLLEMIWYAHRNGYKVRDVPVIFKDRIYGKSKMNLFTQPLKFFLTLLRLIVKNNKSS